MCDTPDSCVRNMTDWYVCILCESWLNDMRRARPQSCDIPYSNVCDMAPLYVSCMYSNAWHDVSIWNEWCRTFEWVVSHACHTFKWVVSHAVVSRVLIQHVKRLIRKCDITRSLCRRASSYGVATTMQLFKWSGLICRDPYTNTLRFQKRPSNLGLGSQPKETQHFKFRGGIDECPRTTTRHPAFGVRHTCKWCVFYSNNGAHRTPVLWEARHRIE